MKTILLSAAIATASLAGTAALADQVWVGGSALNARSGPGTHYAKVTTFPACTELNAVGYANGWAKVTWHNAYYWVSAKYLRGQACAPRAAQPKNTYRQPSYRPNGYSY
ncbi:hypothetical protein CDO87_20295 [Sagittula sp. P11]|uniref:SH3 domain-containing protein n=1 Tax=Sagittula sp. P11 TaxID=2009329 RepID=UPI000C2D331E|nr:SH3 domain-containing protein [Sagittula sp. P11]AUC55359.1 hypothetical protein CDO87_20295 [Sagittula sp. P11]